jgi:glycosyltransferase involved in cell wall biosynthesis
MNISQIGTVNLSYNELKNFSYARDLSFQHVKDLFAYLRKAWHRLSGIGYSKLLHSFSFPLENNLKIFHCFNSIYLGKHSWFVTFETTLPRFTNFPNWLLKFTWHRLASTQCRQIIAMSNCSKSIFLQDLELNRAQIFDAKIQAIREKIKVLHPPQAVSIDDSEKSCIVDFDGSLKLALVGHDFFRKGGLELLLALDKLLTSGHDIQLNIVSKMIAGDYASRAGDAEIALANNIINKYPEQIFVKETLPNSDVINLLRKSHIICLPTWGDTYGYSVLEGQSAGCAAITTNIRALPEINNSECGWVIEVPKVPSGDADIDTREKRKVFQNILIQGIQSALEEALGDRQKLREKSRLSLKRIRDYHNPENHQAELLKIYSSV